MKDGEHDKGFTKHEQYSWPKEEDLYNEYSSEYSSLTLKISLREIRITKSTGIRACVTVFDEWNCL